MFAELVGRLTAMGIEPLGAMERAPTLVERRHIRVGTDTPPPPEMTPGLL